MGNRPIPRIDLREAVPWLLPRDITIEADADGDRWVQWDPYETRTAQSMPGALDAFVKLACYREARWRQEGLRRFVERWGPWGYCAVGDRHEPLRLGMKIADGMGPWSPKNKPQTRELEGDVLLSASRVNALRRVAARLRDYLPGDPDDWRIVRDRRGRAIENLDIAGQQEALASALERWLASAHVRPALAWGDDDNRPAVGLRVLGTSGALALEFVRELAARVPVAVCGSCRTTFQVESTRRTRCASCESNKRTKNRRDHMKEARTYA